MPNAIEKSFNVIFAADAAVRLVGNAIHFAHWVGDKLHHKQHILSDAEHSHVMRGGKVIVRDADGKEYHFN